MIKKEENRLMPEIIISNKALKELMKIDNINYLRISDAINILKEEARPQGCKKLTDIDAYRIRVGSFRILYEINDDENQIKIYKISKRDKVYK
jgi:mRNA interferase RelE/StbE